MCRWLAYYGSPIRLDELIYKPSHSLIDQSLHSKLGVETTNGDGFGVGWYSGREPTVFHSVDPAWNNRNLRNLASHIESPIILAHIRASTGTPVQESNCHPFRHGKWMWMHNGSIAQFAKLKRDLVLAVDPELYPAIEGSTDSELMFFLALTFGLADDPPTAVARMAGLVEATAAAHGVPDALQMTVATSDGERIWAFRYSTARHSRSLFFSTDVRALRELYPDHGWLQQASDESRLIVSEPFGALEGAWNAVPENSYGVIQEGSDRMGIFRPRG
ncbi:MAG: class II glutamine amidotransferase [Hamadaea sp.]|uniref:class II glutamine amidotransferase n=1 Tax=Hamadaea sp. TaxID=2024425 RepID=UPI0017CC7FA1|nr:class II glutamine amidotransferase [Hamadaea sp.]NUR73838.1 class II glutamine amidotransferase [Hamadaea sp.]NUT18997.1 class II glutamine amidotransferase [Hamadaea sp.]